jgi:deoxyribodipyrimidine photolyase-related protein
MADTNTKLRLILGDQLNLRHSWFEKVDSQIVYVIGELSSEVTYVKHHIQKIVAFFAAMRAFSGLLEAQGHRIIYIKFNPVENKSDFPALITDLVHKYGFQEFEYQEPDEFRLDQQLKNLEKTLNIPVTCVSSEHFITDRYFLKTFFKGKKTYLLESFYRDIRKKTNLLMQAGQPEGGKWNFDQENRNKFPANQTPPTPYSLYHDLTALHQELLSYEIPTFGNIQPEKFPWPVNRSQALELLQHFCQNLLQHFGTYQDAMDMRDWVLFHSRLSFALNVKMLNPIEVCEAAIIESNSNEHITISQVEGFVRQIIGWREYMRGVYWAHMPEYAEMNFFNHQTSLPAWFWTGETKMACLKHAIKQSLDYAYAHHIQRLMVTGNFALLAGIHPDEVDQWYLGIYIDAIEWVEITNTRGMSQFADGGIVGTKPYNSSANYINKMSNYCKGCFYDPKKRTGPTACPFNSLYWDFYDRNRNQLKKNPRIGMAYRNLDRMSPNEKAEIIAHADWVKRNLDQL